MNRKPGMVKTIPNPCSGSCSIKYYVPFNCNVRYILYDNYGKEVYVSKVEKYSIGVYSKPVSEISGNSNNLKVGIYYLKMIIGDTILNNKIIIAK